jgi:hypothetical protein
MARKRAKENIFERRQNKVTDLYSAALLSSTFIKLTLKMNYVTTDKKHSLHPDIVTDFCNTSLVVALCGLVVSVLATRPKVRGRWIFKRDKNP